MKKIALLLVVFALIIVAVAQAEMYEDKKEGVKFNVPEEFKKTADEAVVKTWEGPKKGEMIWTIHLQITDIPGGLSEKAMHDIHFKSDSDKKRDYASVTKISVKNAAGAFLIKEVDKPDSEIYHWYVKAFGNKRMYQWNFAGSCSTFKEFEPIIMNLIKSIEIEKATHKKQNK